MQRARRGRSEPLALPASGVGFGLALVGLPVLLLLVLRRFPALDVHFRNADAHFVVMTAIALCAMGIAGAAVQASRRAGQGALQVLATSNAVAAVVLLGHGLTTPGVGGVMPPNAWVSRYAFIALAIIAVGQVLTLWPRGPVLRLAANRPIAFLLVPVIAASALVTWTLVDPGLLTGPEGAPGGTPYKAITGLLTIVALLVSGTVHWRWWRLGGDRFQMRLAAGAWLSSAAVTSLMFGELWRLSWWDYHAYLLAGYGSIVWAIFLGARRAVGTDRVLADAFNHDPLAQLSRAYPDALRALVAAVEARDAYTHGHSRRVAAWSVRIGMRMGLRPAQLRALAQGAYLHDVGKIAIPDDILNKPGRLTDAERARIEEHPVVGAQIVGQAQSLRQGLAAVRSHHERVDGSGYPDGLVGEAIPLIARITAVADVWDALTSDRAYRAAWPGDRALAHMVGERGTHFDPEALDAFLALLREEEGITPADSAVPADPRDLSCHPHPHADGVAVHS